MSLEMFQLFLQAQEVNSDMSSLKSSHLAKSWSWYFELKMIKSTSTIERNDDENKKSHLHKHTHTKTLIQAPQLMFFY